MLGEREQSIDYHYARGVTATEALSGSLKSSRNSVGMVESKVPRRTNRTNLASIKLGGFRKTG